MLPTELEQVIEQIHHAPQRLVLEFAGAGSLALCWLHGVAGSSRTILEAGDRYSAASLADLLGEVPAKAVSQPAALAMARRAYERAALLDAQSREPHEQAAPLLGVACTASIATHYTKRGEHHAIVAVQQATGSVAYTLTLRKGLRNRAGEEQLISRLIVHAMARACVPDLAVPLDLAADEALHEQVQPGDDPLARLLAGSVRSVTVRADGQMAVDEPPRGVALLSGAFNPLHAGHEQMAQAAAGLLGVSTLFELPVVNADKGTLVAEEVTRRLQQFAGQYTVVLSRAPLFVEKGELFPGCVFVVGYDTAVRLVNPRYYGGEAGMHAAFEALQAAGCRFLVAGRIEAGQFRTLADSDVPPAFAGLFQELPEAHFRRDLSSTELREQAAQ